MRKTLLIFNDMSAAGREKKSVFLEECNTKNVSALKGVFQCRIFKKLTKMYLI